jgi:biopolymer transport protein ExbD
MSGSTSSEVKAEPNLTPILDMVFQLITFFMLVINFKSAELDLTLKLPVVGSAQPVESQGQTKLLILNIDDAGNLKIYGTPKPDIERYIRGEAADRMKAAGLKQEDIEAGEELKTTIVIRADRATPFGKLNKVIKACQDNGFRQFALKAIKKEA